MNTPVPVIEIQGTSGVRIQSGTSKRTGNPYSIRKQEAWYHNGSDPYPTRIEINLDDNQPPYNPGLYELDISRSVMVDRYSSLTFGKLFLLPAKPKDIKAAS